MTAIARLKTKAERRKRRREQSAPTPAPITRHVARIAQPRNDETPTTADNT